MKRLIPLLLPSLVCAQSFCGLIPLRPLGAPANAQPVCTCSGNSCSYLWQALPAAAPTSPVQIDSRIPLQVTTPPPIDFMGAYGRALQIQQIQLQNQQRAQEIEALKQSAAQQEILRTHNDTLASWKRKAINSSADWPSFLFSLVAAPLTDQEMVSIIKNHTPKGAAITPQTLTTLDRLGASTRFQAAVRASAPESSDDFQTGGAANGRFWKTMTDNSRKVFLIAYYDATMNTLVALIPDDKDKLANLARAYWPKATIDVIASELDTFYEILANQPVQIHNALVVISFKLQDFPQSTITELTSKFRDAAK